MGTTNLDDDSLAIALVNVAVPAGHVHLLILEGQNMRCLKTHQCLKYGRSVSFIAIAYWVWKLDKRLFTRSSLALWASGLLKTRFWIWSDTLLMAMYAMLRPDSRSDAFFSTKS